MTTTKAEKDLETAKAALATEEKRLQAARAEFEGLTADVEAADPDGKGFAQLVAARDLARGRAEALEDRESKAREALEAANECVAGAERAAREREIAELDAEIAAKDRALTAAAVAFKTELATDVEKLRALVSKANALHMKVGGWDPRLHGTRGAYWLQHGRLHDLIGAATLPAG